MREGRVAKHASDRNCREAAGGRHVLGGEGSPWTGEQEAGLPSIVKRGLPISTPKLHLQDPLS